MLVLVAGGCGTPKTESTTELGQARYAEALEQAKQRTKHRLQRKLERARSRRALESEAATQPTDEPTGASLDALGERLDSQVGATVGAPGADPSWPAPPERSAWSTIKVPIALEVTDEAGGAAGLTGEQRSEIERALTLSDNDAAAALFQDLVASHGGVEGASKAVTKLLRKAGDASTSVSTQDRDGFSTYGQTEWSLPAQQTFMSSLVNGCIGSSASRQLVLDQMGAVTSDSWGLVRRDSGSMEGGVGPRLGRSLSPAPEGNADIDGREYVATLAVIPNNGDFATGQGVATEVARWILSHAPTAAKPSGCP